MSFLYLITFATSLGLLGIWSPSAISKESVSLSLSRLLTEQTAQTTTSTLGALDFETTWSNATACDIELSSQQALPTRCWDLMSWLNQQQMQDLRDQLSQRLDAWCAQYLRDLSQRQIRVLLRTSSGKCYQLAAQRMDELEYIHSAESSYADDSAL